MPLTNGDVLVGSVAAQGKPAVSGAFDVVTGRAIVDVRAAAVMDDAHPGGSDPGVGRPSFDVVRHGRHPTLRPGALTTRIGTSGPLARRGAATHRDARMAAK